MMSQIEEVDEEEKNSELGDQEIDGTLIDSELIAFYLDEVNVLITV